MIKKSIRILYCSLFLFSACQQGSINVDDAGNILAKVYNKSLYLEELDGMVPPQTSPEDSTLIVNSYVERWVRKNLLMHEAEKNIPQDLNIDKLVRDYRASLIRHSFEQMLVQEALDSVVSQNELSNFYEKNKEQYQLETPIIRCRFIKIIQEASDLKDLRDWWHSDDDEDFSKMITYCNQNTEVFVLEDSTWQKMDDILSELPEGTKIGSKKEMILKDDEYHYFLKILEKINRKEIAPLSYIENQATRAILHKRKIKLLEEREEKLYEQELKKDNVKIYSN